ncbi:MAG TPA: RidA family protein [Anaerolineales bacterium]|nr:RidA family protein [Anaerolineales bacterium]
MSHKTIISSPHIPQVKAPYSVGVVSGNFVFTAGQIALHPETMQLVAGGIEAETRQVLENLKNILEAAGSSLDNVLKTTVYLRDLADFAQMNAIYAQYFTANYPARTTIQAAALPLGALVEIEAVGVIA